MNRRKRFQWFEHHRTIDGSRELSSCGQAQHPCCNNNNKKKKKGPVQLVANKQALQWHVIVQASEAVSHVQLACYLSQSHRPCTKGTRGSRFPFVSKVLHVSKNVMPPFRIRSLVGRGRRCIFIQVNVQRAYGSKSALLIHRPGGL